MTSVSTWRGLVAVAALLACSSACNSNPNGAVKDAGPLTPSAERTACTFGAGDSPAKTLPDYPTGSQIPIDHIVLVMQENRSFDHYYSSLTVSGQTVDGASPTATNPDPTVAGATVSRFHQTNLCFTNPNEGWNAYHRAVDDGGMDRFTVEDVQDPADPNGHLAMGYYDGTDLPYYYALAQAFTISDRHFCSVLGPTWPNRLFYMAGTSFGVTDDTLPPADDPNGNPYPNLFTRLNDAGISWTFYAQDSLIPTLCIMLPTCASNRSHIAPESQFFTDALAGKLSSISYVEGSDLLGGVSPDEHPPADVELGQAMVASIVSTLESSPNWPTSALFVTYDENGGLYDHVPPPQACVPDDIPPVLDAGDAPGQFNQLGIRVPLLAVSPYAKRGYVSHQVTDHASILRFIEARFNLPALTHRDANAVPPFDMFDFSAPNVTIPSLPDAGIDPNAEAACASQFPAP